jgi:hypothetical protein
VGTRLPTVCSTPGCPRLSSSRFPECQTFGIGKRPGRPPLDTRHGLGAEGVPAPGTGGGGSVPPSGEGRASSCGARRSGRVLIATGSPVTALTGRVNRTSALRGTQRRPRAQSRTARRRMPDPTPRPADPPPRPADPPTNVQLLDLSDQGHDDADQPLFGNPHSADPNTNVELVKPYRHRRPRRDR